MAPDAVLRWYRELVAKKYYWFRDNSGPPKLHVYAWNLDPDRGDDSSRIDQTHTGIEQPQEIPIR